VLLATVAVWVFGYFALAVWSIERTSGVPFPEWFAGRMLSLTVFLIPLIFLAGAEMGEIAALVGGGAGSALERLWRGWGSVLASVVVAAGTLWWVAPQILAEDRSWIVILASCGLVVLSLLALTLATGLSVFSVRSGSTPMPHDVPYGALATAAVGLAGAHVLVSVVLSTWWLPPGAPLRVGYAVVRAETPAPFSIAIPEGTELAAVDIPDSVAFARGPLGSDAYVIVTRYPEDGPERARLGSDRALISHVRRHATGVAFLTETERFAAYEFELPARVDQTHCLAVIPKVKERWLVHACATSRHWERYYSQLLIPSLRSFRADLSAQPEAPVEIAGLAQALARTTGFSLMPLLLGWVGLHLLGARTDDPPEDLPAVPGPLRRAGVFMVTIAALAVGFFPLRPFTTIGGSETALLSPLKDLLAVTAVASLLFSLLVAAAPTLRGRRSRMSSDLLAANLGLLLLAWLYELYGRALTVQDVSTLLAAGLLVATLLWDLVMSGHPITNLSSPAFPRPARVLLWAGYVTMVGTGVLFYSSQTAAGPGAAVSGMFETDETVRQGILWLGSAVLLSTLLTGLSTRMTKELAAEGSEMSSGLL
jgi:preprotein translocase subunit SecG